MEWKPFIHCVENRRKFFPLRGKLAILPAMNTVVSAIMILWIFGMVIYLTRDM
jgi:hypothetical protein